MCVSSFEIIELYNQGFPVSSIVNALFISLRLQLPNTITDEAINHDAKMIVENVLRVDDVTGWRVIDV